MPRASSQKSTIDAEVITLCRYCKPLIKAIDVYLAKADDDLADELEDEGYVKGKKTAKVISELEDEIAESLSRENTYILEQVKKSVDLEKFASDIWPGVKLNDKLAAELAGIFKDQFTKFMPEFSNYYMKSLDAGLQVTQVSQRTLAWVDSWSQGLADLMQLNSHTEIESILKKGLENGSGIAEFSRDIMESGIRDPWYKARRTAVTEVLTAHRAAQQEALMQSPSTSRKMWKHTGIYIHGPRENHLDMDGTIVPVNEPYELQGADGEMYYPMCPGDTCLPAAERIECHCISQPVVDEDVLGLSLEERQKLQQEAIDELDEEWERSIDEKYQAMVGYIEY